MPKQCKQLRCRLTPTMRVRVSFPRDKEKSFQYDYCDDHGRELAALVCAVSVVPIRVEEMVV